MSYFSKLEKVPQDPIFGLVQAYKQDNREDKIDLGIGVYYNENLQPEILKSVKIAEKALVELESSKVYLPIDGDPAYIDSIKKLILGESLVKSLGKHLYACQALGGTGALRTAADLLRRISSEAYISDPTWVNHFGIFSSAGFSVKTYPYYDPDKKKVSFDKMVHYFNKLHEHSVIVIHGCCHNPTGMNLSHDEWKELSSIVKKKKLIPVFDLAYQGMGTGIEEDAYPIRVFSEDHHEMFICAALSKTFGLYAERVGLVMFVGENLYATEAASSQIKQIIRTNYSNPPKHGALVVSYILNNQNLQKLWHEELRAMRERIHLMRSKFTSALAFQSKSDVFNFLDQSEGLFCFTGLSDAKVERLREEFAIYLTKGGRVNVSALNDDNLEIVVSSIIKVCS